METINATGKPCPIPVIEAKKALRSCAAGDTVRILVDNDIARQNLEKMAKGMHSAFSFEKQGDGNILVTLMAQEGAPGRKEERSGLVLAIGKNTMGTGNEELGAILIKGFVYSLTELDPPPEMILFFNSGIKLSTEGSAAVKDLKSLEEKGCIISSCGTCLDFYNLRDKLVVGNVTNMYAIAEAMAQAGKLINIQDRALSDRAPLEYVFSFNRTVDAIMGEKCLMDAGIPVMVMPMPAYAGSSCGICLRVEPENFEEAEKLLKDTYSRILQVTEDPGGKLFREQ